MLRLLNSTTLLAIGSLMLEGSLVSVSNGTLLPTKLTSSILMELVSTTLVREG